MERLIISILSTLNQFLTAGIAITAFSLLLHALTFNLRDRVARSFTLILACVVVTFAGDAIGSAVNTPRQMEFWLRLQWIGISYLPAAYLHLSDALLATTGRPSRGRRRLAVRLSYLVSTAFLLTLPFSLLVGPLVQEGEPAPHLGRTWLTWVFTLYYAAIITLAMINFIRAYRRTVTRTSRRRMGYLVLGALAPALGSYPYLLFGSGIAARWPLLFWLSATLSNLFVSALLILMAYAVAFFGVSWPDRVVKRRMFKWLMRGPVAASTVLVATTLVRRAGEAFGQPYTAAVPIVMVALFLVLQHLITLIAPWWERWLFYIGDHHNGIELLQRLEERVLTTGDLKQFLESVLAAMCDRLQASNAFIAVLVQNKLEMLITLGSSQALDEEKLSSALLEQVTRNGKDKPLFTWGDYWLVPLLAQNEIEPWSAEARLQQSKAQESLLGLIGIERHPEQKLDEEQLEALTILTQRAALALEDRYLQQNLFSALAALAPEVELIQNLQAATRYSSGGVITQVLTQPALPIEGSKLSQWVKDALTHYWGGPKLTQSPLIRLNIVQQALKEHEGNPTNALRAVLRQAIERVRPAGERRFTAEWILYNILEMKFVEGRKVREVALRLAMSEADLYRKQRVAIEAVANAILEMERSALEAQSVKEKN